MYESHPIFQILNLFFREWFNEKMKITRILTIRTLNHELQKIKTFSLSI